MATIGGITVQFIEAISLSDGRRNQIVDIPYGTPTGYGLGGQLTRYNLRSAFYGDTLAEAKAVRAALRGLVKQHQQELVQIVFDADNSELDGWFLVDSLETDIQGATKTFDFTMAATRLAGVSGAVDGLSPAVYSQSNPLSGNCWTAETWISVPNREDDGTSTTVSTPTGGGGMLRIIAPVIDNPFTLQFNSNLYGENVCGVFDTSTSPISKIQSPAESGGGIAFYNCVMKVVWNDPVSGVHAQNYSIEPLGQSSGFDPYVTKGFNFSSGTTINLATAQTEVSAPQMLEYSDDRLSWVHRFYNKATSSLDYKVTFTLIRGLPVLYVKIKAINAALNPQSTLEFQAATAATKKFPSSPYCWAAQSYTDQVNLFTTCAAIIKTNSDTNAYNGTTSNLPINVSVAIGETKEFGIYIGRTSLGTSASAASFLAEFEDHANRYMANMSQQIVLVNPSDAL